MRTLPVDELHHRIATNGSFSIGFVGIAAGLGHSGIVRWALGNRATFGLPNDVFFVSVYCDSLSQCVLEAARWASLCGHLRCLKNAAAFDPQVLKVSTHKVNLSHFASVNGHFGDKF